jgi:D-amino-acid oxidase
MKPISRRAMLARSVGALSSVALAGGCSSSRASIPAPASPTQPVRRFAPVQVARGRLVRTVAGLRPYRPSGFVVRAEKRDDKTVVHNYGHGGGGISLSWGSAALAVELIQQTGSRQIAILGCGVMGLSTARLLQDRGYDVTIYTKDVPPNTTSNIAGAQWSPFTVHDAAKITPAYQQQFERAARFAHRYFQNFVGPRYGVRWIENYSLRAQLPPPRPDPLADLYPDSAELTPEQHPFPAAYVRRFNTMFIEPSTYLSELTRDYLLRGGRIVMREFGSVREVLALAEPVVVNCTGLGARVLFDDAEVTPLRGQLAFLLPQPEVDYIVLRGDFYMFPRSDGILLGGSREPGEWSAEPTTEVIDRILSAHTELFTNFRNS